MSFFNTGAIRIVNTDASSVTINAPTSGMTSNYNFTLPPTAGTNNYILKTDGSGATDWIANSSGAPTGADASSVMFKDESDLSGVSTFVYDSVNNRLIVLGDVSANTMHADSVTVATDISSINIYATGDLSGSAVTGGTIVGTSDVSGATMHAGSVSVVGDVSGTNIIGTSDVSGATMHAGSVSVVGDVSGTDIYGSKITTSINIITPRYYDNADLNGLINPKTLDASSNSTMVFNLTAATTYDVSLNSTDMTDGQIVNLFYKSIDVNASVAIDFGPDGLLSGSGNARTLTFNSSGQSANLTYLSSPSQFAINNVGGSIS